MKNILVNLVNQKGAGPKNISAQFLAEVKDLTNVFCIINTDQGTNFSRDNKRFIVYEPPNCIISKVFYYLSFYYFKLPVLVRSNKIERYLVFGNYLHGFPGCRARVLIHHPYLFDLGSIFRAAPAVLVLEALRFITFRVLLVARSNVCLVVQTLSMQRKLANSTLAKFSVDVIGNPMSGNLRPTMRPKSDLYTTQVKKSPERELKLGYISRYYPHKRHDLILHFIEAFRKHNIRFSFVVTLDKVPKELATVLHLYPEIKNLGELNQSDLQVIYEELDATIFFSDRETFGNPILESLRFGVPVFGLDRDYFRDFIVDRNSLLICASPNEMAESISTAVSDSQIYEALIADCLRYSERFCEVDTWVSKMCDF